ncbi:MAG: heavy metal translocating P-type ATPase [Deltaproteobacteria bacterium]|nr:heavy metal translocating P-type ATPase [Deltaproteobacteria bacterium]
MSDAAIIDCTHCGLPVPPALVEPGAERQFCCNGCRTVYAVLHDHGLDRYYDFVDTQTGRPKTAKVTGRGFEEFDDPAFQNLYARDLDAGLRIIELYLEGVHCAACVWLVEKVPVAIPGVVEARLDFGKSLARVVWDPAKQKLSEIARFLDSLGYPAHPFRGVKVREIRRREDRAMLVRIGVAAAAAGNVMFIAFALYGAMFSDMDPELKSLFRWTSLGLTIPAVLWSGSVFFTGAWAALRTRTLHMDLPIAIGLAAGFFGGALNTVRGVGEVYFDSVTVLIFLLLVGRWLQTRQQRQAADAAELLFSLAPTSARRIEDGVVTVVPLEALKAGDLIEVRAGETIAADGMVEEGRSELDLSLLTGESRPVSVREADRVHSGITNLASRIVVRVESTGENTRVGRLMALVEEHARRRAPIVRMADRISGWFVAAILSIATITFIGWSFVDLDLAIEHTMALLIVTCPCALGLATPLAVSAAIGKAARIGILVKGGDAIEQLAHPGTLWLDKTGTVTRGRTELVGFAGDESVKPFVGALEAQSTHPVARACVAAFGEGVSLDEPARQTIGGGIEGVVGGVRIAVGSPDFIAKLVNTVPDWAREATARELDAAHTPVHVAHGGRLAAVMGFGDPLRDDAARTIVQLRARGWRVGLLSGDHPQIVNAVGRRLEVVPEMLIGGASPEDKLHRVEESREAGTVVMVGDGVNDAVALSAASVGVAVHGGAEAGLAAADVFLTREGIEPIVALVEGSRKTVGVIRRNLAFSLAYNLLGVTLAVTGVLNPLIAALMMPASSITVITSSFRAKTFSSSSS